MSVNYVRGLKCRATYPLEFSPTGQNVTAALIFGAGTSTYPESSSTASKNFLGFYTKSTATSGDSRGLYHRHYLAGAGVSGEALRAYATVQAVAAENARGAHISLDFSAYATSYITGEGRALKATLHIPNGAMPANGSYSAIQANINMAGTGADPSAVTVCSLIDCTIDGGDATARARVKTFLSATVPTGEEAAGNMHVSTITAATMNAACTEALRCVINGNVRWIPLATAVT